MFIKLSANNSTRKIKMADNATLAAVQAEIVKIFGEKAKEMSLSYKDTESEVITITSEEDWEVCVEEFKEKNQGKPTLSVSLQLAKSDEFVIVNDSKLDQTEISTPQEESEIKEEPKLSQTTEEFPDNKIVEEVKEEEISEKQVEENIVIPDQIVETEFNVPVDENTKIEDLNRIAQDVSQNLSRMLGIPVDVMEVRVEKSKNDESSFAEESVSSTLTTEQRTEIEDIIEEKMAKMLNMKKPEKKVTKKEFTHWNIVCDGCKKGIRNMARFKSLVKADYDLCEECEKTGIHPGPMVKYNEPTKYSPWQLNNKFREFSDFFNETTENHSPREERNHCHRGQGHFGPFRHIRPGHPCRGPFGRNPHDFLRNMGDTIKPLGDLFTQLVPGLFAPQNATAQPAQPEPVEKKETHRCKKEAKKHYKEEKKCKKEAMNEARNAEKMEVQKEEPVSNISLAQRVVNEVPEFCLDLDILESIISENGFTTVDQVVNYLL